MTQKEKWIEEYSVLLEGKALKDIVDILVEEFDEMLNKQNIKASMTHRLKGKLSLAEKIKRNEMDSNPLYQGKKIEEVLDDMIGIRIICMKIVDEDKIYKVLKNNNEILLEKKINMQDSLNKQPKHQKNGHPIYRIKGIYDGKYMFELQIKSLANLFWGEMEHLLIYKNNKYLINNTYYKNEMDSIYKELEIIDDKLTYMEEIMTNENEEYYIEEKKEVLKRTMYLNLKEQFRNSHEGEYLNNNHIFEGIANIVFMPIKTKKSNVVDKQSEYNKILKNSLTLFLDIERMSFSFEQFNVDEVNDILDPENHIHMILSEIFKTKRNGWWYMLIILSLISYNKSITDINIDKLNLTEMKTQFDENIEIIVKIINIKLYANIENTVKNANDEESSIMRNIIDSLKNEQLKYFASNKDMRWTSERFQDEYNRNLICILKYIRENISNDVDIEEKSIQLNAIVHNLIELLNYTGFETGNVKNNIEEISSQLVKMGLLKLPLDFTEQDKVYIKDVIFKMSNNKEGEKYE